MVSAEEECEDVVITEGVSLIAPLPFATANNNNGLNGDHQDYYDGPTGRTNNHSMNAPTSSSPLQQTLIGMTTMTGQRLLPPLQWDDKFFDNDDIHTNNEVVGRQEAGSAVIGVFDFDYDRIISYNTSVKNVVLASTFAVFVVVCIIMVMLALDPCPWVNYFNGHNYYEFDSYDCLKTLRIFFIVVGEVNAPLLLFILLVLLSCYPCFYRRQIQWQARSQHVAITQDGVLFVRDAHRTKCGLRCSDVGRVSTTVPFDKISSCDVKEPAGLWCCCIANVLSEVTIHQIGGVSLASDTGTSFIPNQLKLVGLKEPHKFQQVLMTMIKASRAGNVPHYGGGQFAAADGQYNFASSQPAAGLPVAAMVMDSIACGNKVQEMVSIV